MTIRCSAACSGGGDEIRLRARCSPTAARRRLARSKRPRGGGIAGGRPRPRHARPRRHRRAEGDARARHSTPGHRADRAGRHRDRRFGDAQRRLRFRRQAGLARTAAAPRSPMRSRSRRCEADAKRAPKRRRRPSPSRTSSPKARRWTGCIRLGAEGRRLEHPDPDRGRIRRRQGTGGARHPGLRRAALEALRHRQLRRHPRQSGRNHPVRPREGLVHRRHRKTHRQVRRGAFAARFSSTRSATCRSTCRSSCCAPCRTARSIRSAARSTVKVDIRLISATHRDLLQQVKDGKFREDLFYRLNVYPIVVPPLRDRRDDIPHLVRHFMARVRAAKGAAPRINAISRKRARHARGL